MSSAGTPVMAVARSGVHAAMKSQQEELQKIFAEAYQQMAGAGAAGAPPPQDAPEPAHAEAGSKKEDEGKVVDKDKKA